MRGRLIGWLSENGLGRLSPLVPGYLTMLVVAVVLAAVVAMRNCRAAGLSVRSLLEACMAGYVGALGGAYLLGVAASFLTWIIRGGNLAAIWRSGFHAYGGFIGGLALGYVWLRRKDPERALQYLDQISPALALGTGITRIGCFLAGCDFGRISRGWPGLRFPASSPTGLQHISQGLISPQAALSMPVLPTQLFESAVGFLLFILFQFALLSRSRRHGWPSGSLFFLVVLAYAVWRFGIEFVRGDVSRGLFGPFSTSQWISLVVGPLAAFLLFTAFRRKSRLAAPR